MTIPFPVRCVRARHLIAAVVDEDGVLWLDIPRWNARPGNNWVGTARRVRLAVGSADRAGCSCGRWVLLEHANVIEALGRGDDTLFPY